MIIASSYLHSGAVTAIQRKRTTSELSSSISKPDELPLFREAQR